MSAAVLKQLLYMLSIAAMSFAFSRRNGFGEVQSAFASRLLLYFVNPCLILNSFITPYSVERMKGLALAVAMSLALHLLFTALAILTRRQGRKGKKADPLIPLDRIGIVFTNCGFIGIPLINGALGADAVFYLMGYIAVFNVYIWIYGAQEVGAPRNPLKVITNPNVLAVIAGIALFLLPTIPPSWTRPLSYIGEANTALSMILLGMLFAEFVGAQNYSNKTHKSSIFSRAAKVVLLRMAVMAAVAVLLTAAAWHFVPHTQEVHRVLVVCCIAALCPIGMSVSTFACVFCGTEREAKGGEDGAKGISPSAYSSLLVLSSSAVSVITVPLFVRLAEILMKG